MSIMENFLDSDPTIMENNLRFVKNDIDEALDSMFGKKENATDCKIVMPTAGLCIKCFKVNSNEKFFINLCQTDSMPAPADISEDELTKILNSDEPSSYRIPMSISEPRTTPDKSGNPADVCDVAINSQFLRKCEKQLFFRDFLIAIVLEALSEKYNAQIKPDNWVILRNRKCMGTLVSHRIQNRDVKTVCDTYKAPTVEQKRMIEELKIGNKKLIQEIDPNEAKVLKKDDDPKLIEKEDEPKLAFSSSEKIRMSISRGKTIEPRYKFIGKVKGSAVTEIIAEFFLPKCVSVSEIILDIGEDRILLESMKHGYLFDKFFEHTIDQRNITAKFNKGTKMLSVKMPTVVAKSACGTD